MFAFLSLNTFLLAAARVPFSFFFSLSFHVGDVVWDVDSSKVCISNESHKIIEQVILIHFMYERFFICYNIRSVELTIFCLHTYSQSEHIDFCSASVRNLQCESIYDLNDKLNFGSFPSFVSFLSLFNAYNVQTVDFKVLNVVGLMCLIQKGLTF